MTAAPIRIVIVDDHFLVRMGLANALAGESDLQVVGEAGSAAEALTSCARIQPDLVLLDGVLPDRHGLEVAQELLARQPVLRIVMVSMHETAEDLHRAFAAGVHGYAPKSSPREVILQAIRAVAAGARFLPPELARRLEERNLRATLSPRELDVLQRIAQGRANKQIAHELALSEATVKTHIAHILEKLQAPDRTRAVTIALERGLLRS